MLDKTQSLRWSELTITSQKLTHHFDLSIADLDISLDDYEHDTKKLTFEFTNTMPSMLTEISELNLKKTATQHSKNPKSGRRINGSLLIDKMGTLELVPCYPEKPLVIGLCEKLELCPQSETQVFVISIANLILTKNKNILHTWNILETPKKTLYGDPTTGIISYTLQEELIVHEHAAIKIAQLCPLCVIHPLHIINKTDKSMPIKELLVNFSQLSIYEHNGILTSESIRYEYNSDSIQILTEQQPKHKNSIVIQKPVKSEPSLVLQGLQFFKNMVGF